MRIRGRHLFYCTNVHPGEDLADLRVALETHVISVKARVCPDAPFGVGLRLSANAAEALDEDELAGLRRWLDDHGLYVCALNGFPYGRFHGRGVKEAVYAPDWLDERRADYTLRLAHICAALTPDDVGSVTTVPGAFGARVRDDGDVEEMAGRLRRLARSLAWLREETGKTIVVALEPEPACFLARASDAAEFFRKHLLEGPDEAIVRRHLGVCIDACHLAVELESPRAAVHALREAGITIARVQLSTALRIPAGPAAEAAIAGFRDDVYLHQVTEVCDGAVRRFVDLPSGGPPPGGEWLVHFHVPLFLRELGALRNTQEQLVELLAVLDENDCSHLEVETYTWGVLPAAHRGDPIELAIARELRWAQEHL